LCGRQPDLVGEGILSIVGHDLHNTRQRGDLVGTPRRVTTRNDDAGVRVFPGDLTDNLAGTLIRRAGHRARIDNDKIRIWVVAAAPPFAISCSSI
jgi:hypothetical protein